MTKEETQEINNLQTLVTELLSEAKKQGASSAEAGVSSSTGQSTTVRLGEIETVERTRDHGLGVTVYFGHRKGSASTTDLNPTAVKETVIKACTIARHTSEDPYSGLADPELLAKEIPDLALYHPWQLEMDDATEIARACETAARDKDSRITNSEGASLSTQVGSFVYGNSNGFIGGYPTSRHGISCSVIAQEEESMQRDYWYDSSRNPATLDKPEVIGRIAAERTLARLHGRQLSTRECPVLFRADVAPSLLRGLTSAIRGPALYRQASFLLDQLGERIFPEWVHIKEEPHLKQGLASAPFDNEGVATMAKDLVNKGVLESYLLDSYSARKLGMSSTANAGGVRNLSIDSTGQSFDELLKEMDKGLLVTEMMGQGVNTVTGDYSRGASGFWVEHGEIQYPVEEITIAGNMKLMFDQLAAVGADNQIPGSVKTGSWLIENMTVAGQS